MRATTKKAIGLTPVLLLFLIGLTTAQSTPFCTTTNTGAITCSSGYQIAEQGIYQNAGNVIVGLSNLTAIIYLGLIVIFVIVVLFAVVKLLQALGLIGK